MSGGSKPDTPTVGSLERQRQAELELVKKYFLGAHRVLEFGAGTGWQARLLSELGCEVTAIDREPASPAFAPVIVYDGATIPFEAGSFDAIFSSNVLEHVVDVDAILAELRRVLRVGGTAVFILPSTSWRIWASLTAYPHVLKLLMRRAFRHEVPPGTSRDATPPMNASRLGPRAIRVALLLPLTPHGEYPTSLHELYFFSRRRWTKVFRRCGFDVTASFPSKYFYTPSGFLPGLSRGARRSLARALGAPTNIFVLHRSA